jgi:ATP-dependent Clp protease ATP-binding subunit ClpC
VPNMERYTDRAKLAIAHAQNEANALGHNYVGTEHLLIALLREGGVGAAAMKEMGLDADRAIVAIKDVLGMEPASR